MHPKGNNLLITQFFGYNNSTHNQTNYTWSKLIFEYTAGKTPWEIFNLKSFYENYVEIQK